VVRCADARIVTDRGGAAGTNDPIAEIVEPSRRVDDGSRALAQQLVHPRGERVHREVPCPQVTLERVRAKIDQVHHRPARPRHDAPGAARLIQHHEARVEPAGEPPAQLERAPRHRQVEIRRGAARQDLAEGAAHHPHGPRGTGQLDERGERAARRLRELIQPDEH
jgi:hypothetical protein